MVEQVMSDEIGQQYKKAGRAYCRNMAAMIAGFGGGYGLAVNFLGMSAHKELSSIGLGLMGLGMLQLTSLKLNGLVAQSAEGKITNLLGNMVLALACFAGADEARLHPSDFLLSNKTAVKQFEANNALETTTGKFPHSLGGMTDVITKRGERLSVTITENGVPREKSCTRYYEAIKTLNAAETATTDALPIPEATRPYRQEGACALIDGASKNGVQVTRQTRSLPPVKPQQAFAI